MVFQRAIATLERLEITVGESTLCQYQYENLSLSTYNPPNQFSPSQSLLQQWGECLRHVILYQRNWKWKLVSYPI